MLMKYLKRLLVCITGGVFMNIVKKILKGVIAIFLVLVVIGILVGKDDTKKDNTQTATQTSSSTETKKSRGQGSLDESPRMEHVRDGCPKERKY